MSDKQNRNRGLRSRAFTLIEILVVVVLLGILAAIFVPMASGFVISAKQSALAHDLDMLRRFVLIYKSQHMEIAPGYPNGDVTQTPTEQAFYDQMTLASTEAGATAPIGTPDYPRGPYMMKVPVNPMNQKDAFQILGDTEDFPANVDDTCGWIFKPSTQEVRAGCTGSDDSGKRYYDY